MATILLIEDDRDSRDLVRILLEGEGHEIVEAMTAESGLERAGTARPDLVLLDISLPGAMDGLEVARRLRSDERFDAVPIVALTAHALRGDRERMIVAGCDEHVTKPIQDLGEFTRVVDAYLLGGRTPRR